MTYTFTRLEARTLDEFEGHQDVVRAVVVGMTGTDEESGIGAYRDTLVSLPDPDEDDYTSFENIDEAWVMPIAEQAAEDGDWEASIAAEVEAIKIRPATKPFAWQADSEEE